MSAKTNGEAPAANPALAFWDHYMEQTNELTRASLEAMRVAFDPQLFQKRWLDAVADQMDEFQRSPAFLDAMKRNMKAAIDLKVTQDDVVQRAARQVGSTLASDITGLYERLHSHEHVMLKQLGEIEHRLAAIESKLEPSRPKAAPATGRPRKTKGRGPSRKS